MERTARWAVGLETLKDLPPGYVAALGRRMFSVGRDAVEWNAEVTPVGPEVRYVTRPAARLGTLGMRGVFGGIADRILIVVALLAALLGVVCTIVAGAFTPVGLIASSSPSGALSRSCGCHGHSDGRSSRRRLILAAWPAE